MKKIIGDVLLSLGVNPENNGFMYTLDALELLQSETPYLDCKMMNLYKDVAEKNNTSYLCVERSIRYMIDSIKLDLGDDFAKKYFEYNGKVNNKAFLGLLYYKYSTRELA